MSLYDVHHERIERDCPPGDDPFCRHMWVKSLAITNTMYKMIDREFPKPTSHEDDNFLGDANAIIEELLALAAVLEVRVHG